ncbi:MAG: hypothetical protein COB53_12605 [Elusimicrobia bacterium]|nr:MAG: hypothetical protein COB53_12605 [Elusimicrobiota bacterium]
MIRLLAIAVLALPLLTQSLSAAPALSFEAALSSIRSTVRETQKKQIQAKDASQASSIRRVSNDLSRYRWDLQDAQRKIKDISRRAKQLANDRNRDPNHQDPFLRNDIRRLLWDLRDLNRDLNRASQTVSQLLRTAKKSPESVSPAQSLVSNTRWLKSDAGWMESDARWLRSDLRRAGFTFEGWDIEREVDVIDRKTRDLERDSRSLQTKVR